MTATLIERHAGKQATDVLRLHRYDASVLLGNGQRANEAADLEFCRHNHIEVARRVTGGGAVYMTPDMLAWELIVDRARLGGELAAITAHICSGIARGLSLLGVETRFCPPNDIEIDGRKVSGSSGYSSGRTIALQGTVLIGDDRSMMAAALRTPLAELRSRVTNLNEQVGIELDLTNVAQCLVSGLTEAMQCYCDRQAPTDGEVASCETLLRDEIGQDAFVFGDTGPTKVGTAA